MIASVTMQDREFGDILQPDVGLRPETLAWNAMGGPEWAVVNGAGDLLALGDALNWLRRPITISIDHAPVWWGYVAEATVSLGTQSVGASLEDMSNRVCVAYSYVEPGTQEVGQRQTTDWAENTDSIAIYGKKEIRLSVDGASPATAEAARNTYLNQHAWPQAHLIEAEEAQLRLLCRGWWETLSWVYYRNSNTASRSVTNQIGDAILSAPFNGGADLIDTIADTSSEYRDGESTLQDVILELLQAGESSDLFLTTMTQDRVLKVYRRPLSSTGNLKLGKDGRLLTVHGTPVQSSPAGQWCDVDLPILTMLGYVASPSPFLIRRAELDVERSRWRLEPWGAPSAWELTRIRGG